MRVTDDLITGFGTSALREWCDLTPWEITAASQRIVVRLLSGLGDDYHVSAGLAIHSTSIVENGAVLKGPLVVGPQCFIAAGAYLRGGCWLEAECILGPGVELKSSFVFAGSNLAHFNFVGDSILGHGVNLEAGSIIANRRNERPLSTISFIRDGITIETNAHKFGAVVGDQSRIGANAVIAPGAILSRATVVERLTLVDQDARTPLGA
jgi:NDP-sugar pyrophosphorylase family protein